MMQISNKLRWSSKPAVQIYLSKFGKDKDVIFQAVPNFAKAISFIDKIYCQSAALHLL